MKRHPFIQRLVSVTLGAVVAALFVAVAIPHHHSDSTPSSHKTESCRACKIQEGFSASPSAKVFSPVQLKPTVFVFPLKQSVVACAVVFSPPGRAPPVIA